MIKILYTRICETDPRGKMRRLEHETALRLLRIGLVDLGVQDAEIKVSTTGKPFLAQGEFHFNLTHSGGLCACAIADHPVGIDVERIVERSEASLSRIADRMFSDKERTLLRESHDPLSTFYEIWVKKESIVKETGEGIKDLSHIDSTDAEISLFRIEDFVLALFPAADSGCAPQEIIL